MQTHDFMRKWMMEAGGGAGPFGVPSPDKLPDMEMIVDGFLGGLVSGPTGEGGPKSPEWRERHRDDVLRDVIPEWYDQFESEFGPLPELVKGSGELDDALEEWANISWEMVSGSMGAYQSPMRAYMGQHQVANLRRRDDRGANLRAYNTARDNVYSVLQMQAEEEAAYSKDEMPAGTYESHTVPSLMTEGWLRRLGRHMAKAFSYSPGEYRKDVETLLAWLEDHYDKVPSNLKSEFEAGAEDVLGADFATLQHADDTNLARLMGRYGTGVDSVKFWDFLVDTRNKWMNALSGVGR